MYLGHNDLTIFKDILANRGLDYDRALFLMNNDQALNEVRAIKFLTIFFIPRLSFSHNCFKNKSPDRKEVFDSECYLVVDV